MRLPKYVRLQGRETSYVTKKPAGVWTLCWRRVKSGEFSEDDKNRFIESDNWFKENLPYPPFYGENNNDAEANTKGAVCYFKTSYADSIAERFDPVFELLEKYKIPYDIIYTDYPGKIIYEDDCQIGVVDDNEEDKNERS